MQQGQIAVYPPGEAREDWKILRAASEVIGKRLPYDTIEALRAKLVEANPVFGGAGFAPHGCSDLAGPPGDVAAVSDAAFVLPLASYWLADAISRASPTMAECADIYGAAKPALAAE